MAYVSDRWNVDVIENLPPLHVPVDSPVVETLLRVYRSFTDDNREPLTMGGATYARAIPNAVAFGAARPGNPEVAHQVDEHWALEDYFFVTQIYAQAMLELANTL